MPKASASSIASNARITAIGSYLPEEVINNAWMSERVDTSHEWIVQRTGIHERRRVNTSQYTSDLAIEAVRDLQTRYNMDLQDTDAILVATTTPDMPCPSVASRVQMAFGVDACLAVDLSAACAGFVTGLQMANGLILSGGYRKILVIGAETLSRITDYTDRSTCILFGDGAGAVLVEAVQAGEDAFLASSATTDGSGGHHVYVSGLSATCNSHNLQANGMLTQNGREVYKWALSTIPDNVNLLLAATGHSIDDIDWFVPHSANLRMIEAICERLALPLSKALESVAYCGNTSAASIPLALDAACREGKLAPGQLLVLYGFGSGLTQAGLTLRWTLSHCV